MSARFDAGNTADNTSEIHLSSGNVNHLQVQWSAALGSGVTSTSAPVAAGNVIYVSAVRSDHTSTLYAFAADGTSGCSGSPSTCAPLWTATGGAFGQPLALDGAVYVDRDGRLTAYDANGQTNCAGSPVVCQPLWTGTGGGLDPKAYGGLIYVLNPDLGVPEVDAYSPDASSCPGTPTTCSPVSTFLSVPPSCHWTQELGQPPVVVDVDFTCTPVGAEFTIANSQLLIAYHVHTVATLPPDPQAPPEVADMGFEDATPPTQPAQWTILFGKTDHPVLGPSDLIAHDGEVFWSGPGGSPTGATDALTSAGVQSWRAPTGYQGLAATADTLFGSGTTTVDAYAAVNTCFQSDCSPERSYHDATSSSITTPPVIAADVLYVGAGSSLEAYSAPGTTDCAGSPVVCSPLRTVSLGAAASNVSVTNGRFYVTTADGRLLALATF
jgi:hypothetical protein